MDEVHDKRSEWGADFVALLTSSKVSGCGGIAFLGPSKSVMFSVTLQSYLPAVVSSITLRSAFLLLLYM